MDLPQKGTVGITYPHEDMPYTKDGIVPDIIMNPFALPSRMTVAHIIECALSKLAAIQGFEADATPFSGTNVEEFGEHLVEKCGFSRGGTEILYNGKTGEQIEAQIFFGPTYYYKLKHMVDDKVHCLTMDHEVLTNNGWKFFKQISMNDKIATLKDGCLVYEKPIKLLHYPDYEGKIYHIKSQEVDLKVTSNHRMWVSLRDNGNYSLMEAKDIHTRCVRYQKHANWEAPDYQFVPAKWGLDKDAWLTCFGICMTENRGTINPDQIDIKLNRVIINPDQIKIKLNPTKSKIVINALVRLGFNYQYVDDTITILENHISQYILNNNKELPKWVWKLSARQCRILIKGMLLAYGSYYSSSTKLEDDFMRLCLHAGWSAYKKTVQLKSCLKRFVKINIRKNRPMVNYEYLMDEMYDFCGEVFCLQVPSEVFYVRRNGKPVWTGNSRAYGPNQLLTRQPSEGRSRDGGLRLGEMERDVGLAHGIMGFLKERMFDCSDKFVFYLCKKCGMIAVGNREKNIFECRYCENQLDFAKVQVPYSTKLLLQEIMSMGIVPRLLTSS